MDVAGDNLDVYLEPRSEDEVGSLVRVFNHMTAELAESRDRLSRAERIAAWQQIARRVAHEIKNPLFPIQMSMETLKKSYDKQHPKLAEIIEESTRTVLEEVRSLNRIVTEFSDFARLPAPELEETDVSVLLDHVYGLYRGDGSVLRYDKVAIAEKALGRVPADREQLGRALINLVKNAIEALPEDGAGTVTLDAYAETKRDKDGVVLAVADTGVGMPEEVRTKIFTPYFTTKSEGTGLGLAIVERIVSEHGGTIDVASSNAGTTFFVWLPRGS
jgi:nitrogen fixation/metabolism regulation signal transduction histidine kinase